MKKVIVNAIVILAIMIAGLYSAPSWAQPLIAEEEEILNFIQEVNPRMAEQVMKVRSVNPVEYREILQDVVGQYREIKELELTRPDLARKTIEALRLEGRVEELADQHRKVPAGREKEKLRKEIRNILAQLFDNKIELEEVRANEIEKDLKQLKERTAQRKQNKDKIIEKRLSDITAEEYLRW